MQAHGGINPYDSRRFGFGYIDTIQKQRAVTSSFNGLPVSNQRDQMDNTTRNVLRLRKAMEAVKQLIPEPMATTEIEVSVPGGVDVVNASDLAVEYAETGNPDPAAAVRADQDVEAAPVTTADTKMLGRLVNIIANSMNALFDDSAITASPGVEIEALRNDVRSAVTSWFDSEGPQFNTDFGIGFDFEKTEEGVFKFSQADRSRFEDALASPQSAAAVHSALFGTESGGLFNQLHSSLTAAATGSESNADPTGLFVNLSI